MQRVRGLEDARAALASGERELISPPFAACHSGVNYYRAMVDQLRSEFPDADFTFTLCCGDDPAIAHDALRMGFASVICDCGEQQFAQLKEAADFLGATIRRTQRA